MLRFAVLRRRLRQRQIDLLRLQESLIQLRARLDGVRLSSLAETSYSALKVCTKILSMHQALRSDLGSFPMLF